MNQFLRVGLALAVTVSPFVGAALALPRMSKRLFQCPNQSCPYG